MPKYNNKFASQAFIEQMILDEKGSTIGTVRLKPSSVLWKGKNQREFHCVPLNTFAAWITDPTTGAKRTKS